MNFENIWEFVVEHFLLIIIWLILFFIVFFLFFQSILVRRFVIASSEAVLLINRENALVIDLRSSEDYLQGHIVHSINLSISDIKNNYYQDLIKRDTPLLFVCKNGIISCKLARYLKKVGCNRMYVLENGMCGWKYDNLPVVRSIEI